VLPLLGLTRLPAFPRHVIEHLYYKLPGKATTQRMGVPT